MLLPFNQPLRDEIVATATDLIQRFGLNARDEAVRLAEISAQMRVSKNRRLYQMAALEIEQSFAEARGRLKGATPSELRLRANLRRLPDAIVRAKRTS